MKRRSPTAKKRKSAPTKRRQATASKRPKAAARKVSKPARRPARKRTGPALTVHHLNNSRSQRILWLLEELRLPYAIEHYQRDQITSRAPESLRRVHPLGKSPVITAGGRTIAESGAIIDYIIRRHGGGKLAPATASPAFDDYVEWLHYAEGSAVMPILFDFFLGFLGPNGAPMKPLIDDEIHKQLSYIDARLGNRAFLVGQTITAADVQMTFVLEFARARGWLANYPRLDAYVARMQERPAYRRALERGGPYQLGAFGGGSGE